MSGKPTEKSDIIKRYLDEYPALPTLTLAKVIYKEHPKSFMSIDSVRRQLRYYRGALGATFREEIADKKYFKPFGKPNPFTNLPKPIKYINDWTTYNIQAFKILVLADLQVPFFDENAVHVALDEGRRQGVDAVLLNGDLVDFFALSTFETRPEERNFGDEIERGVQLLRAIRAMFPKAQLIWKFGNHEERWEHYLIRKAPEFWGIAKFSVEAAYDTEALGIHIVKDKRIIRAGRLNILHGHEFGRSIIAPVNPARGVYLRCKEHALIGHHHQTSEHTETSMNGNVISCWSTGALCDLHPRFLPINKWNHGMAIVHLPKDRKDGSFEVQNKKIINGKLY